MLPVRIAVVLAVSCIAVHAASGESPVSTPTPVPAEQPDPLVAERDALYAEVRAMDARIGAIHDRERKARLSLREAVGEQKDLLDPSNVDEETAELITRARQLEKELMALKTEIKERLKNHPETVAREERVQAVGADMQALREQRNEIQKQKVKKVGRLRTIEQALAERRKAAVAVDAKAIAEAGKTAATEANADE